KTGVRKMLPRRKQTISRSRAGFAHHAQKLTVFRRQPAAMRLLKREQFLPRQAWVHGVSFAPGRPAAPDCGQRFVDVSERFRQSAHGRQRDSPSTLLAMFCQEKI